MKRYIADLHLNHERVAKLRGFESVQEMNDKIISEFNSVVQDDDLTILLGDIVFGNEDPLQILSKLNGKILIVGGNHDSFLTVKKLISSRIMFVGVYVSRDILCTHFPVHPSCIGKDFKLNIHGHLHYRNISSNGNIYFNVSADIIGFKPYSLQDIKLKIQTK